MLRGWYFAWLPKMDTRSADRRLCTVAAADLGDTAVADAPRAMREYLSACNLLDAPPSTPVFFYRNPDGSPRPRQSSSALLHELRHLILRPAGVEGWATFTLRSFRPGGTTDLRAAHLPRETTQQLGRWTSAKSMALYDRGEHYILQHLTDHRASRRGQSQ